MIFELKDEVILWCTSWHRGFGKASMAVRNLASASAVRSEVYSRLPQCGRTLKWGEHSDILQRWEALNFWSIDVNWVFRKKHKHLYPGWCRWGMRQHHYGDADSIYQRLQHHIITCHQFTQCGKPENKMWIIVDCERGESRETGRHWGYWGYYGKTNK
jgi:hypothetical protein